MNNSESRNLHELALETQSRRIGKSALKQYASYVEKFLTFCTEQNYDPQDNNANQLSMNVVMFLVNHVELKKLKVYLICFILVFSC
jgi:hypothetical protein